MRKGLLTILFVAIGLFSAKAQVTTEGTEFWLGFMQNYDLGSPSSLEVFVTSKVEANVTIYVYRDNQTINFTVTPGNTHQEVISSQIDNPFAASGSGRVEQKAIRVTSDEPISVYAFNKRARSADAAVILPSKSLGNEYFVTSHWDLPPGTSDISADINGPAELLVVATEDDTTIEIIPSVDTNSGQQAGIPYYIPMDRGQVYQLQAFADLTGTLVRTSAADADACKNIAVFGGNQWSRVTQEDCSVVVQYGNGSTENNRGFAQDHLYEQMYPVNTWGKSFTLIPFELRSSYLLKVLASEDNTSFRLNGRTVNLNSGEFYSEVLTAPSEVISDKPVQVAQYSQTLSCDVTPGSTFSFSNNGDVTPSLPGDPFMIIVSPNEQRLREITFNTLESSLVDNYYVNLITTASGRSNITLNGNLIGARNFSLASPASGLYYTTLNLNRDQDYTVKSEDGFIAYVYAFGTIESFGYVAGASLENLNIQIVGEDPYILDDIISKEACINADIEFTAQFDVPVGENSQYNTFDWDFGDGTTNSGEVVTHSYTQAGVYEIILVASDGNATCGGDSEVIRGTVTINDIETTEVIGPSSVCPDVTGIEYAIAPEPDYTYEWIIAPFSGQITSNTIADEITVDWGAANDDAFLKVVPFNSLGCPGDTITYDVKINKRLEPLPPRSDSQTNFGTKQVEVCYTDRSNNRFYTPPTNGSQYEWTVVGGTFVPAGADTGSEVFVDWGNSTSGQISYREFNPSISDCEGYSDVMDVTIYPEIVANPSITDALCNGDANGTIDLSISGGKSGGYTVRWSNGMAGANISGLASGDYEATIKDALGCEVTTVLYTVNEPAELEIVGAPTVIPVRCFQEANAVIMLNIAGGTAPYQFRWSGSGIDKSTSIPEIDNLKAGTYSVSVTDANGCSTAYSDIVVSEPALLEPDLETLINEPICPDASDGTAFVDAKGGSPDYQFYWNNDPNIDEQEGRSMNRGTYTVRIVDANGCETSLSIDKIERIPRIYMPNAFSPNGDNVNDEFKPVADCAVVYSIQIFNRWGSVVFASEDITQGWDGTFEGGDAPNGKYSYVIFYAGTLNGVTFEENIRGTVNLYR